MPRLHVAYIKYPHWRARLFNPFTSSILLYGFDVGKHSLLPEHKAVLDQYAAMVRKETTPSLKFAVAVKGNASRSGSESVNLTISGNRAAAVADYLWSRVGGIAGISALPAGESWATREGLPDGFESEEHRSVVVGATEYPKFGPPPPPPVLKKVVVPPKYKDPRLPLPGYYTVKVLAGWEAGASVAGLGVQLTRFKLEIRDLARNEYKQYYLSIGAGKAELGPPGSLESVGPGEPRHFSTSADVRVWDFEGQVNFAGLNADFFDVSSNYGIVSMQRDLGENVGLEGRTAYIHFRLPAGKQRFEFGKIGVGASGGMGYLSPV